MLMHVSSLRINIESPSMLLDVSLAVARQSIGELLFHLHECESEAAVPAGMEHLLYIMHSLTLSWPAASLGPHGGAGPSKGALILKPVHCCCQTR